MADTEPITRTPTSASAPVTRRSGNARRKSSPGGKKTSRRGMILGLGALGVVGAGALAAPLAIPAIERQLQLAEDRFLAQQLANLEGISIDAAISAAEITRSAVELIVIPLARVLATLDADALGGMIATLDTAHTLIADIHGNTTDIDALRQTLTIWQTNAHQLPISLEAYTNADITSGEKYLRALKLKTGSQV